MFFIFSLLPHPHVFQYGPCTFQLRRVYDRLLWFTLIFFFILAFVSELFKLYPHCLISLLPPEAHLFVLFNILVFRSLFLKFPENLLKATVHDIVLILTLTFCQTIINLFLWRIIWEILWEVLVLIVWIFIITSSRCYLWLSVHWTSKLLNCKFFSLMFDQLLEKMARKGFQYIVVVKLCQFIITWHFHTTNEMIQVFPIFLKNSFNLFSFHLIWSSLISKFFHNNIVLYYFITDHASINYVIAFQINW